MPQRVTDKDFVTLPQNAVRWEEDPVVSALWDLEFAVYVSLF